VGGNNENKRASVSKRKMLGRASVSFFETLLFCGHKNAFYNSTLKIIKKSP
jgi:hypothetical protein